MRAPHRTNPYLPDRTRLDPKQSELYGVPNESGRCSRGSQDLPEDGAGQGVIEGLRESFCAIPNQYERALWLHAHEPLLFGEALSARQADVFRQSAACYSGFSQPVPDQHPPRLTPPRHYRFVCVDTVIKQCTDGPCFDFNQLQRLLGTGSTRPALGAVAVELPVSFDAHASVLTIRGNLNPWHIKGARQAAAVRYLVEQARSAARQEPVRPDHARPQGHRPHAGGHAMGAVAGGRAAPPRVDAVQTMADGLNGVAMPPGREGVTASCQGMRNGANG
jgi:hypothetical protein